MKSLFLSTIFFIATLTPAFGLQQIAVRNLDLDYVSPRGQGEFEKLQIGLSLFSPRYPVTVTRQDSAFLLETPFIDFTWFEPLALIHGLQDLRARGLSGSAHQKEHFLKAQELRFRPEGLGPISFSGANVQCRGSSTQKELHHRVLEDCRARLEGTIDRLEVPMNINVAELLESIAHLEPEEEIPVWAVYLNMEEGEFYGSFWVQSWLRARVHAWGAIHYEDGFKTMAIKMNTIRYGYIPVTAIVMNELKKRIKHPQVKIDPPWIRITLE